ncbi:MAG: TetR/AcrR family transcriptional regulator [Chloroflexia bacterium]
MPPRDEQDYEARRQQIMDAALEVFAHKGFERATNKDIARAAQIKSPGLIYHYFKDKADLLRSIVQQRAPALQLLTHTDELMDKPPREVLTLFAHSFMQGFNDKATVAGFKLLLGESLRRPVVADMFNRLGPLRAFSFFTRYLEHHMDLGDLRRMDPGAAARCFIGPMVIFALTREVFPQADADTLSLQTMCDTHVELFLRGMAPDPPPESTL